LLNEDIVHAAETLQTSVALKSGVEAAIRSVWTRHKDENNDSCLLLKDAGNVTNKLNRISQPRKH